MTLVDVTHINQLMHHGPKSIISSFDDPAPVVSAKNHLASIAVLASPSELGGEMAEGERLKGWTDDSIALKERWNGWTDGTTALMATG